jgi:hypothetical protein
MSANSKGPREDAVGDGGDEALDVTETVVTGELPEGLTVQETIDWVSGDKAKAQLALDAENKRDHPRTGVTGALDSLVNDETGAGIASGEA